MKALFLVGLIVLVLGLLSLVVPIPQSDQEGISVGGASFEVETRTRAKVHPALSAVMILGGLGAMAVGRRRTA